MTLLDKIKADRIAAWKGGETVKLNLLTTLYSEAAMIGKNNGNRNSTDAEVIAVIKKFIKNAEETAKHAAASAQALKLDVVQTCAQEIKYLTEYLPKQLSEDDIRTQIHSVRSANASAKLGDIMRHFKENFEGQYDGKLVSQLAAQNL